MISGPVRQAEAVSGEGSSSSSKWENKNRGKKDNLKSITNYIAHVDLAQRTVSLSLSSPFYATTTNY